MTTTGKRDHLPVLSLDLDGVICAPLIGANLGVSRTFLDAHATPPRASVVPGWVRWPADHLRFDLRRPLPGVREALRALRETHRLVVVTGRRSSPRHWLRWHGLASPLDGLIFNSTELRSAHYKLAVSEALEAVAHIDDDGPTAQLIAERGSARPILRDWPRNRGLPYHPRVERVADLPALAALLAGGEPPPTDLASPAG